MSRLHLYTPNGILNTSEAGVALIKKFEAFVPDWYSCAAGVRTIGYGTTAAVPGAARIEGPITEAEADLWLRRSLARQYEPAVEQAVEVPLASHQFDALVSFVYNVGAAAFRRSTLLRKLNRRDYSGAAGEFDKWVYAGGKTLRGLVIRRSAERRLFERDTLMVESLMAVEVKPMTPRPVVPLPTRLPRPVLRAARRL